MNKAITFQRANAISQGRIKPNSMPTHIVKGPSGWVIVPDLVKA